ncbi:MAG: Asp-tRNA(Asn)/Glu-tRNA(Gln) amidotransferase subunit GatB, partial [Burkholderiaceae bacterium]|nr:Asp-tRNA(Asn)/Glu-tRNA(Gln) amidotransferase subunit GatB [Burkholderiaceae bacterium]
NYFYPDLPKGYQISQFESPIVQGGALTFIVQPREGDPSAKPYIKTVKLTRAHLEEDAGKSLHEEGGLDGMSGIDLNRAGVPLLEIVSEPEMRSAAEAVAYAKAMHALVIWLDVCDGNMQEGSFRCDANVSVRRAGDTKLGTRCEIKNLNSFRFLERAIEFEARRQIELIEDGGTVVQETRLYDAERNQTRPMRSKEDAMDYRYFPDPDLLPLAISAQWIEQVRGSMPELPGALRDRFVRDYQLSPHDAQALTASRELSVYYEALAEQVVDKKIAANWVIGELSAALNDSGLAITESPVSPAELASLLTHVIDATVSNNAAKAVFKILWKRPGKSVGEIIDAEGLRQISDVSAIEKIVDDVIAANARSVDEFRSGKEKAFNALVGQAMKAARGKANPQQVNEILRRKLRAA